ncbi:peptidylprolyl isomerase [Pararhodobacter marinus]|uniref:Parvulin-like PPIase n=1 Tax=Pararhodobacter marinus TaxID=2184063 RepID=A0A2U2CEQ9_9RHOB|nr:peptidylprolyl isomerase [Pararhodobacter marinus]PWE30340.1 hypothetical protein C4N9_06545 [Pararhodobacter marinus]
MNESRLRKTLGSLALSLGTALATALVGAPVLTGSALIPAAQAQSPFAAALYVNDDPITNYDITQKMRFLQFIGAAGDNPRERAIERLIEDRLQMQEGRRLGGRVPPDAIEAGIAEFAARAEISSEELVSRLSQAGVDRETLVSFISAGVIWRELVRTLYASQIRITEAQIDQALSLEGLQPTTEILLSEIFLPSDPQFAAQVERIIPQIQRMRSETEFSNAARQVSAAPSGPSGGRIDRWVNIQAMPPQVSAAMATAPVGTVIGPIEMPGAYAFFQLRARREARQVPPDQIQVEFRRVALPGGRSEANLAHLQRIRENVDSCVDFDAVVYREFPGLPTGSVEQITVSQSELSSAERTELERLNAGQISAETVENGALVVRILCRRIVAGEGAPSREDVRRGLLNRALEGQAMLYLERLRAEADIRYP